MTQRPADSARATPTTRENQTSDDATNLAHAKVDDPWFHLVEKVKKSNGLLGAMLENTRIIEQTEKQLVLGISKKLSFMFDKIKESENLGRIENFVQAIWHKSLKVEIQLIDEAKELKDQLSPKAVADKIKDDVKKSVEKLVEEHPLVRSAKDTFKAQVKTIKERQ